MGAVIVVGTVVVVTESVVFGKVVATGVTVVYFVVVVTGVAIAGAGARVGVGTAEVVEFVGLTNAFAATTAVGSPTYNPVYIFVYKAVEFVTTGANPGIG